ncbi:sugar ABC transporter ATP-binding protein [Actinomadura madurae]|uniref:sugar ABC transporter ATP-binding protein n=1 Tax=Actinomadura madurae TaxID=1993 RepID=UPI0020D22D85|nr:sugar ABC transporter ATP-binding protein [Actinomadura madurae]MCQ0008262.1 sugar ABC transporter ATP-binding protein [Actinomadura madurae]
MLVASDLSKSYGAVRALRGVSLTVAAGEIVGVCGQNGAGKSTFVKILTGLIRPDSGSLEFGGVSRRFKSTLDSQIAGIAIVDQELALVPQLTVEENMFLGHRDTRFVGGGPRRRARCREILRELGLERVSPRDRVGGLRIGERQLVEIGRLIARDAQLLILDEPTATLSDVEIEHVFRAVRSLVRKGRGVLYVSHRLGEVLDLCDRVVVFGDGRLRGDHSVADLDREKLVRLIVGEAGTARTPAASPSEGESVPERVSAPATTSLVIEGLAIPGRLRPFDLDVPGGTIVALAGQVGSGAGEVLRALAGLTPEARGTVRVGGVSPLGSPRRARRAGVRFVTEDRRGEGLFLADTVHHNLTAARLAEIARLGVLIRRRTLAVARAMSRSVGVSDDKLQVAAGDLSGGNQQKVLIGRMLEPRPDVLLFDEPTRGVDVAGRAEIHQVIKRAAAAGSVVLVASTELDEIFDLGSKIIAMASGRVVMAARTVDVSPGAVLHAMTRSLAPGASDD